MSEILTHLEPALLWLPAFGLVLGMSATLALLRRPLGWVRWLIACVVLLSPLLLPVFDAQHPRLWWTGDTLVTTFAIAAAVRLPSFDRVVRERDVSSVALFFWMTIPMARFWPTEPKRVEANRQRSKRFFLTGALKRLAWEPLGWWIATHQGQEVPWLVRSAVLMLYFVLNITALSDLLTGVCLLLGWDVDTLFDAPLLSQSPRNFWSTRWNKFISRFALKEVALPLGRRWGRAGVFLGVFATSGLFHEYFAWGVGGGKARYGVMSLFFVTQGTLVWVGDRIPALRLPHAVGTTLTFAWMMLTAPLFFYAIEPAVLAFGYSGSWLPFAGNPSLDFLAL